MTTFLNIALINAVTVLPLALLALLVSRIARRPALSHAVWVLVLLKLVTPPLFHLPVTIDMPVADVGQVSNLPVPQNEIVPVPQPESVGSDTSLVMNASVNGTEATPRQLPSVEKNQPVRVQRERSSFWASTLKTCSTIWVKRPDARSMLVGLWFAGAGLWLTMQIVRTVRFQRRVLRDASISSEFQRQTDQLARALKLRRVPQVLIVDATVSPMLWGCGSRAKLLFPADLAERLDENARATLITHELAHFARGDHWVRLLELLATGLFWWHPIVWLAKQQIEAAEEECCDAWVVGQFPDTPKLYAEALLDTIDYLCERRPALPPVACGLGQAHFLRHRLTKIMRGAAPKAMSRRVRFATALVAALLLPLQPFVFGSASISSFRSIVVEPLIANAESSSLPQSDELNHAIPTSPSLSDSLPPPTNANTGATAKLPTSTRIPALRGEKTWSTAASPDGRFVLRTTTARRLILTDLNNNHEVNLSAQQVTAVAFVPDGDFFVAAGSDGRVTLWDALNGKLLRTVLTHSDGLRSIAVSPRGDAVAVGSRDGSVLLSDLSTGDSLVNLPSYPSSVNCVRFSPDGKQLAIAVGDWSSDSRGSVMLLDVTNGQTVEKLDCNSAPGAVAFASKEELIVGLWNGHAQLWNLTSRQVAGSANADKNIVAAAAFSPDNPALLEVTFEATEPIVTDPASPLSLLQRLFGSP